MIARLRQPNAWDLSLALRLSSSERHNLCVVEDDSQPYAIR